MPPPITTRTQFNSAPYNSSSFSSSTVRQNETTSSYLSSNNKTVSNSTSSYATTNNSISNTKKYATSRLQTPGSPSRSRSATKELILPPDDSLMYKPEFTKPLQDLSVRDGDQLILTCYVKGDPDPQITWSKNGKSIYSSDIMDLKYKNGIATLTIHEVFPEDAGVYTCIATNSISAVETKCKLTVEPLDKNSTKRLISKDKPPRIVSHLESRYVKDGDRVTLACRIIGAENFDVVWLHNNKEIKPSKDFEYNKEANIYKLKVAEIFPEDAGTYTCEAFNDAGESYSTCTINVIVPGEEQKQPAFIKFPTSVTVQVGETAKFDCEIQEEPLQLTWLKDGKRVNESISRYTFTKEDGNRYTFTIKQCSMDDVGQYQAKSISREGETFAAFSINVFSNEL